MTPLKKALLKWTSVGVAVVTCASCRQTLDFTSLPFSPTAVTVTAPGGVARDVITVGGPKHAYAITFSGSWGSMASHTTTVTVQLMAGAQNGHPGGMLSWVNVPIAYPNGGSASLQLFCPKPSVWGGDGPTDDCNPSTPPCPAGGPCSCHGPDGSNNDPNSNEGGQDAFGNVIWAPVYAQVGSAVSGNIYVSCH
jgi:hypothetical protein